MTSLREMVIQDSNDVNRKAALDPIFLALQTADVAHSEIHSGDGFTTCVFKLSQAKGATTILAFKTPPSVSPEKRAHLLIDFAALTGAHVNLHEAPTWASLTGGQHPIYNRKREAAMNSSMLLEDTTGFFIATDNVVLDPGGFLAGKILCVYPGFGQKNQFSGLGRENNEWLTMPDTTYAIELVSDNATNEISLALNWYEHTDE